ncbi:hypothetical protein OIE69_44145 (plasmid) [Actinacidiphila glaucinigra]|uniref:hypothetical protein n=1 Tax=Actinacidiphila glaucinigra TaxID=235986 RepID=UPI002DDC6687|nr:hypothetical protein [Actinacidiphila glaucinigra]WSD65897.1 hypothetical protein OIE69_44145 [Actinacidiphila glaucinigra]
MLLSVGLSDGRWNTSAQAGTAITLLLFHRKPQELDAQVPGCQWKLLDPPGMIPPVLRDLLHPRPEEGSPHPEGV